jgi:hypothetical protein
MIEVRVLGNLELDDILERCVMMIEVNNHALSDFYWSLSQVMDYYG